MNGSLWRAVVLALLGVLSCASLAACGGGDAAAPKPKFSSSSAVPTVSSSSPVVESSSAAAETPEAFVRRWVSLQTTMQNSGDSTSFRSASSNCDACTGLADLIDKYYAAGGYVKTRGWSIKSIECRAPATDQASCIAKINNAVTTYKESASAEVAHLHGGPFTELFEATRSAFGWTMARIAEQAT